MLKKLQRRKVFFRQGGIIVRLINVRRGQFVYYNNQLHKVYAIQPFFKQSVHLVRLEDFEQQLTTAREIDLYKPKHLDSFISNHQRYTLRKDAKAKVGDYILVINPRPDSLDRHHLHAIEMVSKIEENGVISNKQNGIKHNEYWVMMPGIEEGARIIDLQNPDPEYEAGAHEKNQGVDVFEEEHIPKIGDVYQKNDSDPLIQAMVIAIIGETILLGGDLKVPIDELMDSNRWSLMHNMLDQLIE